MSTPDLLGDDRERWTPSRGQRRAVLASVLAAVLVAASVAVVEHRSTARAADDAALGAIRIGLGDASTLTEQSDPPSGAVAIVLRNDGPDAVEIRSLRFDGPGYGTTTVRRTIGRYALLPFDVPAEAPCPTSGDVSPPEVLVVEVAVRDLRRELRLHLGVSSEEVRRAIEERCGLRPLGASLEVQGVQTRQEGEVIVAELWLIPRTTADLEVRSITLFDGLQLLAPPALPLVLKGQPSRDAVTERTQLVLRFRVTDCARATSYAEGDVFSAGVARLEVGTVGGTATALIDAPLTGPDFDQQFDVLAGCPVPGDGGG